MMMVESRIVLVGILFLAVLGAAVVAIVVALVLAAKRSKTGKWVAGILAGILVVAAMAVAVPTLTYHTKVPDTLADRRGRPTGHQPA